MEAQDARVGTTLKQKWRIDALLGRGGMATVYAATHRNGKRVAIKMLNPELSAFPEIRDRFLREGYVANKVGHRGAVTVDDEDVAPDGAAFLVMEFLDGETLEARRERSPAGRLDPHEVAVLMDQVLDTLASAHAQGIVHRDLKPENLFLTTEGVVKILDFGIARLREGTATKSATTTGTLMGTPAFLPPEQARGEWRDVDGRTDLWAVGATMFVLLTGRPVHEAETVPLLLLAAMTKEAPPVGSVAPGVPAELAAIVDRALARQREARWPDATTMRGALHDFMTDGATTVLSGSSRPSSVHEPTLASVAWPHIGAIPAVSPSGTVAPITSRTLARLNQPRRPNSAARIASIAGLCLALVGGLLSFAAHVTLRPVAPPASVLDAQTTPASTDAQRAPSAAPAVPVEPAVAPAASTASTSAAATATTQPQTAPAPHVPLPIPTAKPAAVTKPADPFSKRR